MIDWWEAPLAAPPSRIMSRRPRNQHMHLCQYQRLQLSVRCPVLIMPIPRVMKPIWASLILCLVKVTIARRLQHTSYLLLDPGFCFSRPMTPRPSERRSHSGIIIL